MWISLAFLFFNWRTQEFWGLLTLEPANQNLEDGVFSSSLWNSAGTLFCKDAWRKHCKFQLWGSVVSECYPASNLEPCNNFGFRGHKLTNIIEVDVWRPTFKNEEYYGNVESVWITSYNRRRGRQLLRLLQPQHALLIVQCWTFLLWVNACRVNMYEHVIVS
jgi:hypothetical protein